MSDKQFKLIEGIVALDGVKAAEAYKKSTGENVWDVLVSTENGRLVEGTLACKEDLALVESSIEIPVQLNGKVKAKIHVAPDISKDDLQKAALSDPKVQALLEGKTVVKEIVVPGRLVNLVVK